MKKAKNVVGIVCFVFLALSYGIAGYMFGSDGFSSNLSVATMWLAAIASICGVLWLTGNQSDGSPMDYRELDRGVIYVIKKRWEVEIYRNDVTHAILTPKDQPDVSLYVAFNEVLSQTRSQVMIDSEDKIQSVLAMGDPPTVTLIIA
ncbi:MAG: hypothetical protein RLZZ347_139 [Candidatus Parcubacteria bacterium]|jgi:hypothetical protein